MNKQLVSFGNYLLNKVGAKSHSTVGERQGEIEIQGDFSAGTHNVSQSSWVNRSLIKRVIEP